jgi:hypothetical protein
MKKMRLIRVLGTTSLFLVSTVLAIPISNYNRPYDVDFRQRTFDKKTKFMVGASVETGASRMGYDEDSNKTGILNTYSEQQSAIAAFKGASSGSAIANFLSTTISNASDSDNIRGNLRVDGKFAQTDITLWGKYKLPLGQIPGTFYLGMYLPIRSASVTEVTWHDKTQYANASDLSVHEHLTDHLSSVILQYGSLNIGSWSTTAPGDLTAMVGWYKEFVQNREALKGVTIQTRLGISFPSGIQHNEDIAFSLPTGNDGAVGIPLSLGLDADFVYGVSAGLDVTYLGLFNVNRERRLMTDLTQSDYLLLTKGKAIKVQASIWNFNLYCKLAKIIKGFEIFAEYQFAKQDESNLYPEGDDFSYFIVNSAQSIQEWSYHNIITRTSLDLRHMMGNKRFAPRIDAYAKFPIMGKRVMTALTYGLNLSVAF